MSITRYTPQLVQAFKLPVQNIGAFARIAAPWLAIAVASVFVRELPMGSAPALGMALNAVALGGFGFMWQRHLGAGEGAPLTVLSSVVRLTLWVLAYQSLLGFELFASILMNILLEGQANAEVMVKAGQQLFQILIGGLFLLLPHLALATRAELLGTRLQEIVLAAGVSVGFGYVLGYLPFMVLTDMSRDAFAQYAPGAGMAAILVDRLIHFASVVVAAGYFTLVWTQLRATAPSPTGAVAAAAAEAEEPKERRTTRLNRTNKARR